METISSLAQIDAKLRKVNEAAAQSDAAVRGVFNGFQMDFDEFYKELPKDPFSPEYFAFQMQMYDTLAGKKYKVSNEVSVLDITSSITCPFPYNSRNHDTAGMHLSSLGFVIGHMKLAAGSKILEFGAGWGNTTFALALLGH